MAGQDELMMRAMWGLPPAQGTGTPAYAPEEIEEQPWAAPGPVAPAAESAGFALPPEMAMLGRSPSPVPVDVPAGPLPGEMINLGREDVPVPEPENAVAAVDTGGLDGSRERLLAAYNAKTGANQATFEAEEKKRQLEAERGAAVADLDQQEELIREQRDTASREAAATYRASLEKQMEEANRSTDATRFWHNRGTAHKAAGFITAFLGAFQGPDMRQNVNAIIDQAVNRDIEDQKSSIAAARAKITDMAALRQFDLQEEQRDSSRLDRTRLVLKRGLIAEFDKRAAQLGEGSAKAALMAASAAGQEGLAKDLNSLEGAEYTRQQQEKQAEQAALNARRSIGVQYAGLRQRKDEFEYGKEKDARAEAAALAAQEAAAIAAGNAPEYADTESVQGVIKDGKPILIKDPKLRTEMQDRVIGDQELINAADELGRLLESHGREAYGKHKARARQLGGIIQRKLLESNKGPASDADAARVLQEFGFKPDKNGALDVLEVSSGWTPDKVATRKSKIENFIDLRKRSLNTYINGKAPGATFEEFDALPEDQTIKEDSSKDLVLRMSAQPTAEGKIEVGRNIVDLYSKKRAGESFLAPGDPTILQALEEAQTLPPGSFHDDQSGALVQSLQDIYANGSPDYQAQAKKDAQAEKLRERRRKLQGLGSGSKVMDEAAGGGK